MQHLAWHVRHGLHDVVSVSKRGIANEGILEPAPRRHLVARGANTGNVFGRNSMHHEAHSARRLVAEDAPDMTIECLSCSVCVLQSAGSANVAKVLRQVALRPCCRCAMVRTTLDHLSWALRNFSWYLATLSACIGVAVAVFTVNLARIGDLLASMLSTMAIQEKSTGQVVRGVDWVITLTWALLGFLLAGALRGL